MRHGQIVHLDLTHLGEEKIVKRLPMVRELSIIYMGVDPVHEPIPVRPVVHYTMGGIDTDIDAATRLEGLFAAGECACVSINGANRLGSNSLTELLVFGGRAGRGAAALAAEADAPEMSRIQAGAEAAEERLRSLFLRSGDGESIPGLRKEMNDTMETGAGIYRSAESLMASAETLRAIRRRFAEVRLADKSNVYNTDLIQALELGAMIEIAQAIVTCALERRESRGSHQRLDYEARDDERYLRHSLARFVADGDPEISYRDVVITRSEPGERVYGGEQE